MKRILLASAALVAVASTSAEACDFRRTKWNVYFGVIEEDQFAAEAGVLLPPTYVKCKLQFDKYGESFSNTCGVNIITTMGHGQGVSDGDRCHYTDALEIMAAGPAPSYCEVDITMQRDQQAAHGFVSCAGAPMPFTMVKTSGR